jgi:hypothetical protein
VKSGRVERLGGGRFRIAGNVEPEYFVDLNGDPPCYCMDMSMRGRTIHYCKHVLSARLAQLEPDLLQVIADNIERQMQQEREARRKPRSPRRAAETTETED